MDETDSYDSDFEEIQLFTGANSVSPSNPNLELNVCRTSEPVAEVEKRDVKNVEDVLKCKGLDQQANDLSRRRVDSYCVQGQEVKERSLEINETSDSGGFGKRNLEDSSDLEIRTKKQKLTESVQKETDESSESAEVNEPYLSKHNSEDHQTGTSQEYKTKDEKENIKFDVKDSLGSPKCTKDSQTESSTKTKDVFPIDCPPIAIVSPLSGQKSSTVDSPQTELDKDEQSALIAKVDDFDPSILEDFPCSIDEIVCSIFADKNDTFHTLDGNSWTFPDLQQIQTDEIEPHISKENDDETNDDHENNLLEDVNALIKEEPIDTFDQSKGCNTSDKGELQFQSYDKDCTVKKEQMEKECQQVKGLSNETPTMSHHVKGEQTLLDCPSQGKPFEDFLDRYSPSYTGSTDRITSLRQDPGNQKSGYQGLIRPGPPNRMMPDLRRQLGNLCDQGPPARQQEKYPVLQSMIGSQGLHVKPQNQPNHYQGTSMTCPGVNKPNNRGTYLHPDRSTFYAGVQQYQPRHPSSMFPRQPNVNQQMSGVPPSHPGNQYQMWGRNQSAQYPRARPGSSVNGGFDATIRNKSSVNIPQYPQHILPQYYPNNPTTDLKPGLGQFNPSERGAVFPKLEQTSNIQTSYNRICARDNFVNPTVPRQNVPGHGTDQRQQMMPYQRSKHSPINNVFGQENVVSSQRSSPEQLINPPLNRVHNVQKTSNSYTQVQQLLQSGQFRQSLRTPSPVIHNQGLPSVSKPWPGNQPNYSNISSANHFTGGFHGNNMNNVSHGNILTQNESIPSIKHKLTEVIELSKSSTSPRVKTMVNYFVKRVVQVKQSVLSDEEKSNFLIETRNFIESVTKLMNEPFNQVPNNYYVDNSLPKSSQLFNTEPPARFGSQPLNKTGFNNHITPQYPSNTALNDYQNTNHVWSSHPQRQIMPESVGRGTTVGIAGRNQLMSNNIPQENSTWLMDTVPSFDNIVVKNEPTHDLNPLEKFIT